MLWEVYIPCHRILKVAQKTRKWCLPSVHAIELIHLLANLASPLFKLASHSSIIPYNFYQRLGLGIRRSLRELPVRSVLNWGHVIHVPGCSVGGQQLEQLTVLSAVAKGKECLDEKPVPVKAVS